MSETNEQESVTLHCEDDPKDPPYDGVTSPPPPPVIPEPPPKGDDDLQ